MRRKAHGARIEAINFWVISKLVEGQKVGIFKMMSDFRGPEGKSYCLQS